MSSLAARRVARRPDLAAKLDHMAQTLHPLVNTVTGAIHPAFPLTIVQFWLLTDDQLEGLASFYHQRTPSRFTRQYPCPVKWQRRGLTLEDKRRKFGRFIGLRGCETPRKLTHYSGGHPVQWTRRTLTRMRTPTCPGDCNIFSKTERPCMPCSLREIELIMDEIEFPKGTGTNKEKREAREAAANHETACKTTRTTGAKTDHSPRPRKMRKTNKDTVMHDAPLNEEEYHDIIENVRSEAKAKEELIQKARGY